MSYLTVVSLPVLFVCLLRCGLSCGYPVAFLVSHRSLAGVVVGIG